MEKLVNKDRMFRLKIWNLTNRKINNSNKHHNKVSVCHLFIYENHFAILIDMWLFNNWIAIIFHELAAFGLEF